MKLEVKQNKNKNCCTKILKQSGTLFHCSIFHAPTPPLSYVISFGTNISMCSAHTELIPGSRP